MPLSSSQLLALTSNPSGNNRYTFDLQYDDIEEMSLVSENDRLLSYGAVMRDLRCSHLPFYYSVPVLRHHLHGFWHMSPTV